MTTPEGAGAGGAAPTGEGGRIVAPPPWSARDLTRLRAWEIGFGVFCVAASLTNLLSLTTRVEAVPPEVRWWTFALFVGFAALPVVVLLGWRIVGYGVGRLAMQPTPRRR